MGSHRSSLVKPTIDTPFKIDFDWWMNHDRDWRVYLRSSSAKNTRSLKLSNDELIDW